jgi:transposase
LVKEMKKRTVSTLNDTKVEISSYAALTGLDWADQKHVWTMRTADGKVERGELSSKSEAVEVWASELAQRFPGRRIAVALEQSRGAVISMLSKYAHLDLLPVHSTAVANYRKVFCPSGAKSDAKDGDLILDLLTKHPERFKRLQPDTVATRSLQFLTEERRKLVNQHTSQVQSLIGWLKQIFPQVLDWFDNPSSPLVEDLLLRWPTLPQLQKASPKVLLKFLHQHNCRSEERNQQRLTEFRQAIVACNDEALISTGVMCIQTAVRILAQMRAGIEVFDRQIAEVFKSHPDRAIVESFPGAGPALEPRLIAAVGTMRDRFASANALACFAGIAPVTERSGNACWIHWRWACPKFIRQTFHEWAACSIRTCQWARDYYDQRRATGKGHHAAVRALAYKWIRIFFRCWRDRVPYDEKLYLEAVSKRLPQPAPAAPAKPGLVLKTCGNFKKLVNVTHLTD